MKREPAVFVSRRALESKSTDLRGFGRLSGFLKDLVSQGYRLIVVTRRLQLLGSAYGDRRTLLAAIRALGQNGLPITDLMVLNNSFDPSPFWDAARRFNISLELSTYLSANGESSAAARSAGIERVDSCHQAVSIAA